MSRLAKAGEGGGRRETGARPRDLAHVLRGLDALALWQRRLRGEAGRVPLLQDQRQRQMQLVGALTLVAAPGRAPGRWRQKACEGWEGVRWRKKDWEGASHRGGGRSFVASRGRALCDRLRELLGVLLQRARVEAARHVALAVALPQLRGVPARVRVGREAELVLERLVVHLRAIGVQ